MGGSEEGMEDRSCQLSFLPLLLFANSPLVETYLVEGVKVSFTHMLLEDPRLRQEG